MSVMSQPILLAYLDPGSGSALVGTIFAIAGAFIYSLRSLFMRVFLGKKVEKTRPNENIAIFSEGKSYWGTFKPVIEELLRRNIPFSYYTLDVHDPALLMDEPLIYTRLFNRRGWSWSRKFAQIKANVLLSTTPNIGCEGYPLPRPADVGKLAHVFHDPAGVVDHYYTGSLDFYDDVLMVGRGREEAIKIVEKARGTKAKRFFLCGAPYLDEYVSKVAAAGERAPNPNGKKVVLVGSSWGEKSLLKVYGYTFIKHLIDAGYEVIVRPHPHSFNHEPDFIEEVRRAVVEWGGEWDTRRDGTVSMSKADILVSDTSGVRLDFAYLYNRPVISMRVARDEASLSVYDGQYLKELWIDSVAKHIGRELDDVSEIPGTLKELLEKRDFDVRVFRDENCVNFGKAAAAVVDYLVREGGVK